MVVLAPAGGNTVSAIARLVHADEDSFGRSSTGSTRWVCPAWTLGGRVAVPIRSDDEACGVNGRRDFRVGGLVVWFHGQSFSGWAGSGSIPRLKADRGADDACRRYRSQAADRSAEQADVLCSERRSPHLVEAARRRQPGPCHRGLVADISRALGVPSADCERSCRPGARLSRYRWAVNSADLRSLQEGDLESREESLYLLLDRVRSGGDESAAEALRTLVRDYRNYHRSLYTRALNQAAIFGDATLEAPLLTALADTRYNCQAWAAMGCTALGFRAAVPGLLALLDHPQWIAREQAVVGLGKLGDESVVAVLAPLLRDPADWMRHRAAEALSTIGGDAAFAALWAEFEHRRFQRIGYIASALAMYTPHVIPALCQAAASEDPDKRYWAAVALGSTGDDRAVPTLERLMAADQGATVFDGRVSVAAKKALRTLRRIQAAIASRIERSSDPQA